MFKKLFVVLAALLVSACTLHKTTNPQELCAQAKRQQVFNATDPSYSADYVTHAQNQNLNQQVEACK